MRTLTFVFCASSMSLSYPICVMAMIRVIFSVALMWSTVACKLLSAAGLMEYNEKCTWTTEIGSWNVVPGPGLLMDGMATEA